MVTQTPTRGVIKLPSLKVAFNGRGKREKGVCKGRRGREGNRRGRKGKEKAENQVSGNFIHPAQTITLIRGENMVTVFSWTNKFRGNILSLTFIL